jgi:hypothetical protein
MDMKQRAPKILREWASLAIGLLILHLLFFGALLLWVGDRPAVFPIILLTTLYCIGFAAILIIFVKRLWRAHSPPEYAYARTDGIAATAKVLDIERTRWRSDREVLFRRYVKYEHRMRLRVTLPDGREYEAQLAEFLAGEQIPNKGAVIPVKVHPDYPDIVVMILEEA